MIFTTAKGIRRLCGLILLGGSLLGANAPEQLIRNVILLDSRLQRSPELAKYAILSEVSQGQPLNRQLVRRSLENLYRTGLFANIEAKVVGVGPREADLIFICQKKFLIRALTFSAGLQVMDRDLAHAVYSLRANDYLEEYKIDKAKEELANFFQGLGYFRPQIKANISYNQALAECSVHMAISPGRKAHIHRLQIVIDNTEMKPAIQRYLRGFVSYVPEEYARIRKNIEDFLHQKGFYRAEIVCQEKFLNPAASEVDLQLDIRCGFRYLFRFAGMANKMELIRNIWEKNVFEKWAEEESRVRLLNDLKNDGYLDAQVASHIELRQNMKHITFTVARRKRYRLGQVAFAGNTAFSAEKLAGIVKTDNILFNRLFWLRANSLIIDLEVLRLFYYYQGFAAAQISLQPSYHDGDADITFQIEEGRYCAIAAIRFNGNVNIPAVVLLQQMKSRIGGPFIQKQINEDIDLLQNYYWQRGYDDASINLEIDSGFPKTMDIRIQEGTLKKMGHLLILGASNSQSKWLRKVFTLKTNQPFNRSEIERFRTEAERSGIFTEIRLEKISRDAERIDILVHVNPDRGQFYGLGLGWEERKGPRGTLEFQSKNIFRSISTLAATLQLGVDRKLRVQELRGILSYDTPYVLNNKYASSLRLWEENEAFPSYHFTRWGVGAALNRKIAENTYLSGALRWYSTTLTELYIPPSGIDRTGKWFDTTLFSLSFVRENRDDPFNPNSGEFFSADLKLGLPIFEKNYSFFKFFWNYQKHFPLLKSGVFSFSVRNGIGFGDMSITERFFAGGSHSFRGTRNDRLGPISPGNYPVGGNVLLLFNLEATFPAYLIPINDLYYFLFSDIGNIFPKSSDFNLSEMEKALGFGLKYRTPMGPIRLDFAFNLRRGAEKPFLVQIGIGNVY